MCDIIGYRPIEPNGTVVEIFERLFQESRIRGTHAYGIATVAPYGKTDNGIYCYKSFSWEDVPRYFNPHYPTIAHARYSQSGDWQNMNNNQPLVVGNMAVAHNGVISMKLKEEFERDFNVICQNDNDSEIFLQKLTQGVDPAVFIRNITGSFAATWLQNGKLWAGRNARRPLWKCESFGAKWYASTRDIFLRAGFPEPLELGVGVEAA